MLLWMLNGSVVGQEGEGGKNLNLDLIENK